METPKTTFGLPATIAIRRGDSILASLEADGADFVRMDDNHAYMWAREELVNLYDHQHLINYLTRHGYLKPRTENKMIVAAWIIFEALKRCE